LPRPPRRRGRPTATVGCPGSARYVPQRKRVTSICRTARVWNSSRSLYGTPRSSQIINEGTGNAKLAMKSTPWQLQVLRVFADITAESGMVGEYCADSFVAGDQPRLSHAARDGFSHARNTAERFVADPYGPPGSRMYRTGDLLRTHGDNSDLEFVFRDALPLTRNGKVDRRALQESLQSVQRLA
jgi:acyl-CoA synthetase (AMP-forming)/AMP-acid ligase II